MTRLPLNRFALYHISKCVLISAALAASSSLAQETTIPVSSLAFSFSPGNWSGDEGRGGDLYRQTWNPGAYFRVTWESEKGGDKPEPVLLLDTSTYDKSFDPPRIAYSLDGIWQGDIVCSDEIPLEGTRDSGKHQLTVFLKSSTQVERWGAKGESGKNVLRVKGLQIGEGERPIESAPSKEWILIVGDSITEGVGVYEMECYSHLVGEGLRELGFEYGVSACGWSGWLNRGDKPPGDVPGYYVIQNSTGGEGGNYIESESRWNMIDANTSLLDEKGHISAYGATGQEPSVILINYGTNDSLWKQDPGDVQASMKQALLALRGAAPDARIFVLIPFGQYKTEELHRAVEAFQSARPDDGRISIIDLGPDAARALTVKKGYWGGLHPNPRAHATFAAKILARIVQDLEKD